MATVTEGMLIAFAAFTVKSVFVMLVACCVLFVILVIPAFIISFAFRLCQGVTRQIVKKKAF